MAKNRDRNVVVTHGSFAVIVGFHWNEEGQLPTDERKAVYIECVSQEMKDAANKALPALFIEGSRVRVDGDTVSITSRDFDQQANLFDLIVNSGDPERMLFSIVNAEG